MFNDSNDSRGPKYITNNVGAIAPSNAPASNADGNRLSERMHNRERSSWGQEQVNAQQPPTFKIGNGPKARFVTGNANAVARSLPNRDPRIIPPITKQYIADIYGGNQLKHMPTRKEVAKLKSVQLNRDLARGNMNDPMVKGGSFGERSNQETAMQKKRLKTWQEDNTVDIDTRALPDTGVRTYGEG